MSSAGILMVLPNLADTTARNTAMSRVSPELPVTGQNLVIANQGCIDVLIHLGPDMGLKPNLGANGLDDPHWQGDQSFVPRGLSAVLVFCGHGDTSRVYSVDGHMGSLWILRKLIDRANGHRL